MNDEQNWNEHDIVNLGPAGKPPLPPGVTLTVVCPICFGAVERPMTIAPPRPATLADGTSIVEIATICASHLPHPALMHVDRRVARAGQALAWREVELHVRVLSKLPPLLDRRPVVRTRISREPSRFAGTQAGSRALHVPWRERSRPLLALWVSVVSLFRVFFKENFNR